MNNGMMLYQQNSKIVDAAANVLEGKCKFLTFPWYNQC